MNRWSCPNKADMRLVASDRQSVVYVDACFFISEVSGVRCQVSGVSTATGQTSYRSNRKRNFEKANPPEADKYRISNNEFCLS